MRYQTALHPETLQSRGIPSLSRRGDQVRSSDTRFSREPALRTDAGGCMSTWTSRTPFPLRSEPPMSPRTLTLADRLYAYVLDLVGHEPDVAWRALEAPTALPLAWMQVAPAQATAQPPRSAWIRAPPAGGD